MALTLRWWSERESNPRHEDFQSSALPTELSDRVDCVSQLVNYIKINISVNPFPERLFKKVRYQASSGDFPLNVRSRAFVASQRLIARDTWGNHLHWVFNPKAYTCNVRHIQV